MNILITGAVLQAKAEDLVKLFNQAFTCSVGMLKRFNKCHNVISNLKNGEVADVLMITVHK